MAVFGLGATVASMGSLYGFRGAAREASLGEVPEALAGSRWWIAGSFCERCEAELSMWGRQPLIGWAVGCGGCGARGGAFYPAVELAAGLTAATAMWAGGALERSAGFSVVVVWIGLMSGIGAADRARLFVPAYASVGLFWVGLLLSPFGTMEERAWGSLAVLLVAVVPEWFGRGAVRDGDGGEGASIGDLVLAAVCGAWFGLLGGVVAYAAGILGAGLARGGARWVAVGPGVMFSGSGVFVVMAVVEVMVGEGTLTRWWW